MPTIILAESITSDNVCEEEQGFVNFRQCG